MYDLDAIPVGESSVQNVLDQTSLRWIFVGGKGGVGKTTCSCAIATLLAKRRERVLILSTDPAHNVSDAFNQKFNKTPGLVKGFDNLWAMEVDPSGGLDEISDDLFRPRGQDNLWSMGKSLVKDLLTSFPGIDEAVSFAEVMKLVDSMNFSVVVFDTAPTGHTLRLLTFPSVMEQGLERIIKIRDQLLPMITQVTALFTSRPEANALLSDKLDETLKTIKKVNQQFIDSGRTTFICVCIPEFLSIFETERLVQELTKLGIDVHNIIVNMILPEVESAGCEICEAKKKVQRNYLGQIDQLYRGFNITRLTVQPHEVRGPELIEAFSAEFLKK